MKRGKIKKTEEGTENGGERAPSGEKEVWAGEADMRAAEQLFEDGQGRGVHADEGRPYGERAVETGIQRADRDGERVCRRVWHISPTPGTRRH